MDVDALTDDEVIELQERLTIRSAFIQVTPGVRAIVEKRLADLPNAKLINWEDARRRLGL